MLKKSSVFEKINGPVVTIVMDGYGFNSNETGNAIAAAHKPTIDRLM